MTLGSGSTTLHLDRSRTSRSFDLKESLWTVEFKHIAEILCQHLQMVEDSTEQEAPYLALAVYGGYGSGKTSLLETLRQLVSQKPGGDTQDDPLEVDRKDIREDLRKGLRVRLHALPILRPNLLAVGESFLYAFLAAVQREKDDISRSGSAGMATPPLLSPIDRSLQKVIEYLQILDQSEDPSEHDPIGASVARLERHASDRQLKDALQELITAMASRLLPKKGLLLLPIDDADLAQDKLFQTLDTLRRYLDHPQLVPICSFNGRLSEELLVAHFSSELRRKNSNELRSGEAAQGRQWRYFGNEMALQYLSRLFPVRNRIRLGGTTVRVQRAKYKTGLRKDPEDVSELLKLGSKVLFGASEPLVESSIKLALRPTVLRRQLQIIDALQDADILGLFPNGVQRLGHSWARAFDACTWALLDAHHDVLKEADLHLEDIYGWSVKSLREWLLGKMEELDLEERQLMLNRWVNRTENRRGQVFSLLAANVFRPALSRDEEIPGELPVALSEDEFPDKHRNAQHEQSTGDQDDWDLTPTRAYSWFLNLWLGFYLPLILLREKSINRGEKGRSMPTVGWDLDGAPALAMHEVMENRTIFAPGMMLLRAESLKDCISNLKDEILEQENEKEKEEKKAAAEKKKEESATGQDDDKLTPEKAKAEAEAWVQVWVNLCCFYGYHRGRPWLAISLWRILSLIGQLLRLHSRVSPEEKATSRGEARSGNDGSPESTGDEDREKDPGEDESLRRGALEEISHLLRRHLELAHQPTSLEARRATSEQESDEPSTVGATAADGDEARFAPFPIYPHLKSGELCDGRRPGKAQGYKDHEQREKHINTLAKSIVNWLGKICREDALTCDTRHPGDEKNENGAKSNLANWYACSLRRFHGDELLGKLWRKLQDVYTTPEALKNNLTGDFAWGKWIGVLEEYWGGSDSVASVVKGCPLVEPLIKQDTGARRVFNHLPAAEESPIDPPQGPQS